MHRLTQNIAYTYTYECIYCIRICIYIHTHTYIHICDRCKQLLHRLSCIAPSRESIRILDTVIYIYIHTYMYTYTYTYIYGHTYKYAYVHSHACTYREYVHIQYGTYITHSCIHTSHIYMCNRYPACIVKSVVLALCVNRYVCICMCARKHAHIHTHIHVHFRTPTYTYIYIHI